MIIPLFALIKKKLQALVAPAPPPFIPPVPQTASALFMDEDERVVLYQQPWPYFGCPVDERRKSGSTTWIIDGQQFNPSHRDAHGNWIFRRCVN